MGLSDDSNSIVLFIKQKFISKNKNKTPYIQWENKTQKQQQQRQQ